MARPIKKLMYALSIMAALAIVTLDSRASLAQVCCPPPGVPFCDPDQGLCCDCTCVNEAYNTTRLHISFEHNQTRLYFGTEDPIPPFPGLPSGTGKLGLHQSWMIDVLFEQYILPAMMKMSQQFTTTMMQQTMAVGAMIDAKIQLETQLLFQRLTAQAHKDYHPSPQMCTFGTVTRSLADSQRNVAATEHILGQRYIQRALANVDVNAAEGPEMDRLGRLNQFKNRFCDRFDNNFVRGTSDTGLDMVCRAGPGPFTINRDINYMRTVLLPKTLNVDFTDAGQPTGEERDILELASNLYSHDVFQGISSSIVNVRENAGVYMDLRSIVAKRGVAQSSFNAVVAMKAQGSEDSTAMTRPYLRIILEELGVTNPVDMAYYLNDRPSYLSQMELLSKLLYQRPEFYTELYDKPMNVKRRSVAMQGIGLMLERDIYESYLRSEAILAVLLETKLIGLQKDVENEFSKMTRGAVP